MKIKKGIIFLFLSSSALAYHQQETSHLIQQPINQASMLSSFAKNPATLTWQALPFPAIHGMDNVVVMKNNNDTLFVYSPYSSNTTIYQSNDGGQQWKILLSPHVNNIHHLISLDKDSLLLAGDNKIYLSRDQGQHWIQTARIDRSCDKLYSPNPNLILLTTNSNYEKPGLYRSIDGGKTFTPARLGINEGSAFSIVGGKEDVLLAGTDSVFISTNKGLLWEQPSTQWKDKLLSSVAVNHQNDIFLAANQHLYKTDMTGQVWKILNYPMGRIASIQFDVKDRLYAISEEDSDGLYRSLDNGQTWELLHRFKQLLEMNLLDNGKILINTDEGLLISDDTQLQYTKLADLPFSYSSNEHIAALSDKHFFATVLAYAGPLYASADAGKTWDIKRNTAVIDVKAFHDHVVSLEYSGDNEQIMTSADLGNTWQQALPINQNYCYSLSSQANGLLVNCKNESYFTSDLLHWTPLTIKTSNPIFTSYFSGKSIYVTDGNSIQRSSDYGLTWEYLLENLKQHHAYISGYNDEVIVIAVNEAGIIKLTNAGKTWEIMNNGLSHFDFTDLIVVDATHYLVSTHHGIFYTQNGGNTWLPENKGLNNLKALSLSQYQTTLLAGIEGSGLFKAELN